MSTTSGLNIDTRGQIFKKAYFSLTEQRKKKSMSQVCLYGQPPNEICHEEVKI